MPIICESCNTNLKVGISTQSFLSYMFVLVFIGGIATLIEMKLYLFFLMVAFPAQIFIHILIAPLEIKS